MLENILTNFSKLIFIDIVFLISNCKKIISSLNSLTKFANASHYMLRVGHRSKISPISYDNSVKSKGSI